MRTELVHQAFPPCPPSTPLAPGLWVMPLLPSNLFGFESRGSPFPTWSQPRLGSGLLLKGASDPVSPPIFFYIYIYFFLTFGFILFILFIYLWLCWVFVSVRGLSLVAASGGHSSSRCAGLSLSRPLLLGSTGSRHAGSVIVAHGPICSAACGILPDQGSKPCPLHWQADSQPLCHQGSPHLLFMEAATEGASAAPTLGLEMVPLPIG